MIKYIITYLKLYFLIVMFMKLINAYIYNLLLYKLLHARARVCIILLDY